MKSKKIIASITAMSVIAMSSMSFAAINFNNTKVKDVQLGGTLPTTINAKGTTKIDKVTALTDEALNSTINDTGLDTTEGSIPTNSDIVSGTDVEVKTEAIDEKIEVAEKKKKDVKISTDGTDVATDATWVTQKAQDALNAAITKATNAKKTVKSLSDVEKVLVELGLAIDAYVPKDGTKIEVTPVETASITYVNKGLVKVTDLPEEGTFVVTVNGETKTIDAEGYVEFSGLTVGSVYTAKVYNFANLEEVIAETNFIEKNDTISLSAEDVTLNLINKKTAALNVTVDPEAELTFESGTEANVAVDAEGNVTALVVGTSTITVTAKKVGYADKTVTATVTVEALNIESAATITLEQTEPQYADAEAVIAALPTEVEVTLDNGEKITVEVSWEDTDSYSVSDAGDYDFTGTITLPTGVTNTDSVDVVVTVTVE